MSKLRLREGNLLNVAGPEIQMEIMDRNVLCKVYHKKQGIVIKSLESHGKMSFPNWFTVSSHLSMTFT